jgi:hypothetical protein
MYLLEMDGNSADFERKKRLLTLSFRSVLEEFCRKREKTVLLGRGGTA